MPGKARLAGNGPVLSKRRNAVQGCSQAHPQGAFLVSRSRVAALENAHRDVGD